ncbi:hypothetical protein F383_24965 [Gossypium arboreum]|uniref:Uncharacterized protein n=1 Tax=Gossypium arboreum TaxID=29729 RepID=A0A0B0PB84_GOSAR|nr:hypothetical protein F383_24965 [Gossypium arboreum]
MPPPSSSYCSRFYFSALQNRNSLNFILF